MMVLCGIANIGSLYFFLGNKSFCLMLTDEFRKDARGCLVKSSM